MMKRILIAALLAVAAFASPAGAQEVSNMQTASTPFSGSELFYMVQGGAARKTTMAVLAQQVTLSLGVLSCGSLTNATTACSGDAAGLTSGTLANARLSAVPNTALLNPQVTISGHTLALGGSLSLAAADVSGFAAVATSGSATDLTTGTLPNARLDAVPNASLANSSITLNTHSLALGGSLSLAFSDFAGTIAATQLPNPSSTTLGGVRSFAAVSNQWINTISTAGVPSAAQPAATNLSDTTVPTTFAPTDQSGAALTFTNVNVNYSKLLNQVWVYGTLTYPATGDTATAAISLPVAVPNSTCAVVPGSVVSGSATAGIVIVSSQNSSKAVFKTTANANVTNANLSGQFINFSLRYPTNCV